MKELWNRFTSWLSGWPESKAKKAREDVYLFEEEEELKTKQEGRKRVPVVKPKKIKGLNPKKKRVKKQ
jgi:hypothetical protein